MPAFRTVPPEAEPLGLGEAKAFLRLDHDADDDLVERLVVAAREQVERLTRRVLVAQDWRLEVGAPEMGETLALRPRPVREVTAVAVRLPDGSYQPLDADAWRFDWAGERLSLTRPAAAKTLRIDLACGYGPPEDVPETLRLAVRRLVVDGYERRAGGEGEPADVAALVAPYRDPRL
jgi:uncharacterized phiE125 gp8 family phage protein